MKPLILNSSCAKVSAWTEPSRARDSSPAFGKEASPWQEQSAGKRTHGRNMGKEASPGQEEDEGGEAGVGQEVLVGKLGQGCPDEGVCGKALFEDLLAPFARSEQRVVPVVSARGDIRSRNVLPIHARRDRFE